MKHKPPYTNCCVWLKTGRVKVWQQSEKKNIFNNLHSVDNLLQITKLSTNMWHTVLWNNMVSWSQHKPFFKFFIGFGLLWNGNRKKLFCPQGCLALLHHTVISSLTKSLCSKCLWSSETACTEEMVQQRQCSDTYCHLLGNWETTALINWVHSGYCASSVSQTSPGELLKLLDNKLIIKKKSVGAGTDLKRAEQAFLQGNAE